MIIVIKIEKTKIYLTEIKSKVKERRNMENMRRSIIKDYKLINIVGSGATSDVWKAQKDGKDFALKIYKSTIDQMKCMENVMNELNFASKVSDAFAIAPIEAFVSRGDNNSEVAEE